MGVSEQEGLLELEVSNFGPIARAKIDLRPFTLFVGPSNTGKSYLAILIYTLHRLFSGGQTFLASRHFPSRRFHPHVKGNRPKDKTISEDAIKSLFDWVQRVCQDTETGRKPGKAPNPLPEDIADLIRPLFESVADSGDWFEAEIVRCFGLKSAPQLIRRPCKEAARVILRRYVGAEKRGEKPFVHKLDIMQNGPVRVSASIPKDQPLWYRGDLQPWIGWIDREAMIERPEVQRVRERKQLAFQLIGILADFVFPSTVGPASSPAYYLPADRTGVMHAHRVVVSALIERATSAGIRTSSPVPMLSGVLADFLEQLIELGGLLTDEKVSRKGLAARLEKVILGGAVRHERSMNSQLSYPSFSYRPKGWTESLPLMRASSMVSELAPVVLYLRHVIQPGNVLIIEEPESHLHPAMQVEFTRLLAAAVREGVRIIMTTHSEWVLEELANLVQTSALPETRRKAFDGDDVSLKPQQVGAWLFQPKKRPKGSVVQEIPLDTESGTFISGYDDVAASLHNQWAAISSYTKGSEDQ